MKNPCSFFVLALAASLLQFAVPAAQAQVRITEVTISTRNVELTNFGTASVDLTNWRFCHKFSYVSPGGTIAAGATRQFTVNFNQTASDLGLYNSSNFGSAAAMQDFVQWGSGGNGRESVAVSKTIWTTGFFLAVPTAGKSLHAREKRLLDTGSRTDNWFPGWPHAGWPVPDMEFESIAIVGGQWRLIGKSYYLTSAHGVDVRSDLASPWVPVTAPSIVELGGGRLDVRFPATGVRQFTRLRAQ